MTAPLLDVKNLSIRFGGIVAADGVSIAVQPEKTLPSSGQRRRQNDLSQYLHRLSQSGGR